MHSGAGLLPGRSLLGTGDHDPSGGYALCRLFSETDLLRIYAEPFASNMGSRRVLEKAGFQLEGILRSNACKNGQVLDMAMYGLTRERGDEIL